MFFNQKPVIEFVSTDPAFTHASPALPSNARRFLPDWIKRMKEVTTEGVIKGERKLDTVRKCVPFLDAMKTGYIIPAPVDMWFEVENYGKGVTKECRSQLNLGGDFVSDFISEHATAQMSPQSPYRGLIFKFNNIWKINTRPGYSCLFINPINHGNKYFESFSGVVDTDNYHNIINFPFRILNPDNKQNFEFYIKKGDPIIQVIPFKRSDTYAKCKTKNVSHKEWKHEMRDQDDISGNFSWYREHQVEKKITLEK